MAMNQGNGGHSVPEPMDDDMADLFGEPQSAIAPPLEPAGPVLDAEILLRLDEVNLHGCCQKLAWSEIGAAAHIADQNHVNLYIHLFHTKKKEYILFGPTRLEMPQTHQYHLTHVSWNPHGSELAVVDKSGILSVFQPFLAINRFRLQTAFPGTRSNDVAPLGSVVGMEWLAPNRGSGYYHTATKSGDGWRYSEQSNQTPLGPHHPSSKTGVIWVTKGGKLRLLYKSIDESWQETSIDLANDEDDRSLLLTHASFASENNDTYNLATFDISQNLKLYSIKVQWDDPPGKKPPPLGYRLAPKLVVTKQNKIARNLVEEGQTFRMCHLAVLPAVKEPSTGAEYPLTVVGYCGTNMDRSGMSLGPQGPGYKIIAWTTHEEKENFHPVFAQLASKKKIDPTHLPENMVTKAKTQTFDLTGFPIRVGTYRLNTMLWVAYADGHFDLIDRSAMQRVSPSDTTDVVTNPISAGFEFAVEPCKHFDLSASAALAIYEDSGGKIQLKYLHLAAQHSEDEKTKGIALASLAMMFASSTAQYHSNSDIHAILRRLVSTIGYERILHELYKCCTGSLADVVKDEENSHTYKVMTSPFMLRCLVIQQMIDHGDDDTFAKKESIDSGTNLNGLRTIPAKTASIMVEIRSICHAIHITGQAPPGTDNGSDTVHSLIGLFRWFISLMSMLLEDLFRVRDRIVSSGGKEALQSATAVRAAVAEENTPVIAVLLGSAPRSLLKLCSRFLRNVSEKNWLERVFSSSASARSFKTILRPLVDGACVRLFDFERLVDEVNHHVRQAYDNAQPRLNGDKKDSSDPGGGAPMPDSQRLTTERHFLVTGDFPDILFPIVHRLLTHTLERIMTPTESSGYGVDRIRILEMDMRALGLTDEPQAIAFNKNNRIDVLRQVNINGLKRWRRCTRCAGCMEDLAPGQAGCPVWVRNLGTKCTCGNPWVVLEKDIS